MNRIGEIIVDYPASPVKTNEVCFMEANKDGTAHSRSLSGTTFLFFKGVVVC